MTFSGFKSAYLFSLPLLPALVTWPCPTTSPSWPHFLLHQAALALPITYLFYIAQLIAMALVPVVAEQDLGYMSELILGPFTTVLTLLSTQLLLPTFSGLAKLGPASATASTSKNDAEDERQTNNNTEDLLAGPDVIAAETAGMLSPKSG